ncbi:MAG: electron transporter SenC [Rhodocyclales bacterium GWA2_65_20]|nr:MAG: electron transporter SenC [Rhodocyclales bacterium GWA2_65_20]
MVFLVLLAAGIFAAPAWADVRPGDAPKLTSRPLNPSSTQNITTLDEKAALEKSQAAIGNVVSDYALLNRQGQPVRLADFRGKPLLVNFMYTGCFQVCPTTTKNLQRAVEGLVNRVGADRFNIVSIGFNQPFDAPMTMKSFALQQGVHLPNWDFLSPAQALVPELTRDFGFSYVQTSAGFDHLNQVTIVDAQGRIVRQVYGEVFTADMLAEPLKTLLGGDTLPPQTVTLAEIVDRIRILCSVYDPTTGKYRVGYGVIFEIAGAITFVLWLAIFYWRERRYRKPKKAPDA